MTTATQTRRPQPARRAPFRLRGRTRKTVLILHILSVGSWVGVDVIVAVLVLTGWLSSDPSVRGLAYQALGTFVGWPMLVSALVSLVTGVLLGLGSKYGLVRYWWVAIKLCLNLLLATLIVTALRGEVANAAGLGGQLAVGADLDWNFTNMIYPPIVSPTALTIAFLLAVFKPWGRIRRRTVDQ